MPCTGFDDEGIAILAGQQNLAVYCHGRSGKRCGYRHPAAFIDELACYGIEAREDSLVSQQVDLVTVEN